MKSNTQKWVSLLAIGLLCVSATLWLKPIVAINDGLGDFLKGLGTMLVIGSLLVAWKSKPNNKTTLS